MQQREVLLATHAITSGDDHRRSLDVDLALFHFAFDDAYDEIGVRSVFLVIHLFDDSFARGLGDLFFHHALAYGSHLRTAVRVDDRCDDVAAESRTNLVEQVFIDFAALVIGVRADFEARTVGRQAAVQCRRNTGTQIAAHRRSAEQCDLRLFFFENAADDCGVGQGPVRVEALGISDMDRVGTVLGQFFFDAVEFGSDGERFELTAERVSQYPAFGQQLQRHIGHFAVLYLTIYEYVVHLF